MQHRQVFAGRAFHLAQRSLAERNISRSFSTHERARDCLLIQLQELLGGGALIFLWSFSPFLGTAQFYYGSETLRLGRL